MSAWLVLSISLLLSISGIALRSSAAASNQNSKNEPLTLDQLTRELKHAQRVEILEGKFRQEKRIIEFDLSLKTEGEFVIRQDVSGQDVRLDWKIQKPEESAICIDQNQIVLTNTNTKGVKQIKKVKIDDLGESAKSLSMLLRLVRLKAKDLFDHFRIVKMQEREFSLEPKNRETASFTRATLRLNPMGLIDRTELVEKNKDEMRIDFHELRATPFKPSSNQTPRQNSKAAQHPSRSPAPKLTSKVPLC